MIDLGGQQRGGADRDDLVVVAMKHQRRHVEPLEILRQVGLGERLDAEVGRREAGHHALQPERFAHAFRDLGARPVVAVEGQAEVLPELRAIGLHAGAELIEGLDRRAAGIGRGLQHQRRDRADQHRLRHPRRAVPADVAGDLAATGGMADMDRVLQVERLDQLRQVVGIGVQVVAAPGLARPAVAAAVMGDAAVAALRQEEHLVLEGVGAQRPAVAEDDRLPGTPVLVVDLGTVLGSDHGHGRICLVELDVGVSACGLRIGGSGCAHCGHGDQCATDESLPTGGGRSDDCPHALIRWSSPMVAGSGSSIPATISSQVSASSRPISASAGLR